MQAFGAGSAPLRRRRRRPSSAISSACWQNCQAHESDSRIVPCCCSAVPAPSAGAVRRSEQVALDVADLEFSSAGLVSRCAAPRPTRRVTAAALAFPTVKDKSCPVRSLQAWLESAHITEGAVFTSLDQFQRVQSRRLSDKNRGAHRQTARGGSGARSRRLRGPHLCAGLADHSVRRAVCRTRRQPTARDSQRASLRSAALARGLGLRGARPRPRAPRRSPAVWALPGPPRAPSR
jgi:hypothetical protein